MDETLPASTPSPVTSSPLTRRQFISISAIAGIAGLAIGSGGVALVRFFPNGLTQVLTTYPQVAVAHLSDLSVGKPLAFEYPLKGQSSYLVRLGKRAVDGVGPDEDVVAFSSICTHMGCSLANMYQATHHVLGPCPCHFSTFDLSLGGMPVIGAGTENLPQIELNIDQSGTILAKGVWGVIYGFEQNLQPGTPV